MEGDPNTQGIDKGIPIDTNVPQKNEYDTLDETICDTLSRDLYRICHKCQYVLIPRFSVDKKKELQNWDLWGPLLICISMCIVITAKTQSTDPDAEHTTSTAFITLFGFIFFGGIFISLNAQFLGVPLGICQAGCLLGYCVFPFLIAAIVDFFIQNYAAFIRLIIIGVAIIWACLSSVGFISSIAIPGKKFVIL